MGLDELCERHSPLDRLPYQRAHEAMGITERHPRRHQPLGQVDRREPGAAAASCMRSTSKLAVASRPSSPASASTTWSRASKRGSLSSCRSRLYESGKPFKVVRKPAR